MEAGAYGYVRKPPVIRELKSLLRRAFDSHCLRRELQTARTQLQNVIGLDQLIGSSAPMQIVSAGDALNTVMSLYLQSPIRVSRYVAPRA